VHLSQREGRYSAGAGLAEEGQLTLGEIADRLELSRERSADQAGAIRRLRLRSMQMRLRFRARLPGFDRRFPWK
jgi:hypothetical protein